MSDVAPAAGIAPILAVHGIWNRVDGVQPDEAARSGLGLDDRAGRTEGTSQRYGTVALRQGLDWLGYLGSGLTAAAVQPYA